MEIESGKLCSANFPRSMPPGVCAKSRHIAFSVSLRLLRMESRDASSVRLFAFARRTAVSFAPPARIKAGESKRFFPNSAMSVHRWLSARPSSAECSRPTPPMRRERCERPADKHGWIPTMHEPRAWRLYACRIYLSPSLRFRLNCMSRRSCHPSGSHRPRQKALWMADRKAGLRAMWPRPARPEAGQAANRRYSPIRYQSNAAGKRPETAPATKGQLCSSCQNVCSHCRRDWHPPPSLLNISHKRRTPTRLQPILSI